jgi:HK97 family phage prohead protease
MPTLAKNNWNGQKYQWFNISSWDDFLKKTNSDLDCVNHEPSTGWRGFWKFCFSWMAMSGQRLPAVIPAWATPEDINENDVKSHMTKWRTIILDNHLELSKAKIRGEDTQKYIDTLIYYGWKYPASPELLVDINKDITNHYFSKTRMGKKTKYEKNERAPFCYEPLALKRKGNKVEEFYFTATNKITKAFIEAEENGVVTKYTNESDVPKSAVKRYFVGGAVSDVTRDLDNERMSDSCIKAMEDSAKLGAIPLRNAHSKEWDSDIGKLTDISVAEDDKSTLMCKFELNSFDEDAMAKKLWHSVSKGKKIGFSIGGIIHKVSSEFDNEIKRQIKVYDNIELKEVSVTASPANTNTFIHAISKAMKQLEKKPLGRIRKSVIKFAYTDEAGVGYLPIHDAVNTKNSKTNFEKAALPDSVKREAWKNIMLAMREFGITKNTENTLVKSVDGEFTKFAGVKTYFDIEKDYFLDVLGQMREDLKEHMEHDEEDEKELQEVLEEIEDKLEDTDEEEEKEDEGEDEKEEIEDFQTMVRIISILSGLEYPSEATMPDNYFFESFNLPAEAYIYVDGEKMLPHHNMDYTVNRDWLAWQLKQLMDGNVYVDADEYLEILNHLNYHMMEKNLKKSTEEESQPVVVAEDVTLTEVAPEVAPAVEAEAPVEESVKETPVVEEEEVVVEEVAVEEVVTEEVQTKEVVEEVKEEVKEETEEEKSYKAKVDELEKANKELAEKLEELSKQPLFKTATDTIEVVKEGAIAGAKLAEATGLEFDITKSYTEDEAVAAIAGFRTYNTYTVKQNVRRLFN